MTGRTLAQFWERLNLRYVQVEEKQMKWCEALFKAQSGDTELYPQSNETIIKFKLKERDGMVHITRLITQRPWNVCTPNTIW